MRILLATNHLGMGGSESYLLTVAEQLDRLGHEAPVYTLEPGGGVEVARERGVELIDEAGLDSHFDAALVQDAGVSYLLADVHPSLPQLFVAHSAKFDLQAPPQLDGMVKCVVVLNDRVGARVRNFATATEIVRLRQPIDTERYTPRGELPAKPRRALMLSNAPHADRVTMLESACAAAGLELTRLGGLATYTTDIRPALAEAEVVIGYGRSILEAMACGRAAYVYDWKGGDGWVTASGYAATEADGFAGGASGEAVDMERLVEDLRAYSASMGPLNHDLVMKHHKASEHAQRLVELFRDIVEAPPPPRPRAPLGEMARLVRLEWRARVDANALLHENAHLRQLLAESEEARLADARELNDRILVYEESTIWRLTAPLRWLSALLRGVKRVAGRLTRAGRRDRPRAADPGSGATTNGAGSPPPSRGADQGKAPSAVDR